MYTCRYSIIYIYIYAHNISATCCCSGYKPPQQETEGRVKLPVGRWRFQAHRLRQLWSRYREQNKQRNWMNFGHWTLWFYFFDEPKHQTRKGILDVKGGILLSFWRIFSWLVNIHAAIINHHEWFGRCMLQVEIRCGFEDSHCTTSIWRVQPWFPPPEIFVKMPKFDRLTRKKVPFPQNKESSNSSNHHVERAMDVNAQFSGG